MTPLPSSAPPEATAKPAPAGTRGRLLALDALRGFDMFWILGADYFMSALARFSDRPVPRFFSYQLEHADWAGFRFYDLIFPLFIFIVGVSLVFSLSRTLKETGPRGAYRRIVRRAGLLFLLGIFYSGGLSTQWPDIRLMGVLNRIALCYFFAALLFCHCRWRGLTAVAASLLVGYWALMSFVPFPDVRPVNAQGAVISPPLTATNTAQLNFASTNRLRGLFEPGLNLANYVDQKHLPGRKWDGTWDPEGILSTLPAIATCLLGVLAGLLLQNTSIPPQKKVYHLAAAGVVCLLAGWLWHLQFPVIKKIWTSSFVLVAGGYSALLLAAFYQVIEIWQKHRWATLFVWIGLNPITLYVADNLIGFDRVAKRLAGGDVRRFFDTLVAPGFGELVLAVITVGIAIVLARFLYRRQIFLRL